MTMQPVEIAATLFGLACVWLTARQHIACWPTGLVQVSLYVAVFFRAKLYSDMLLHLVYVVLQVYGWYAWLHGGPGRSRLDIARLPVRYVLPWCLVCAVASLTLGTAMGRFTDASFPYVDAFATVASLIAQWLMSRKLLESWLVWAVVDLVSIRLYLAKMLYPTAALYFVFLLLTAWGWLEWTRSLRNQATA